MPRFKKIRKGIDYIIQKLKPYIEEYLNRPQPETFEQGVMKAFVEGMPKDRHPAFVTAQLPNLSAVKTSEWYENLVRTFGEEKAAQIADNLQDPNFLKFFYGDDVKAALDEITAYNRSRYVHNILAGDPLEGKGVLGGSSSMSAEGTLFRPTAAPHDLDYRVAIGGAAGEPYTGQASSKEILYDKDAIENSPIFQVIKDNFFDFRNMGFNYPKFRYLRKFSREGDGQVFVTNMINQGDPGISRTAQLNIEGVPVDLFLTDNKIATGVVPGIGTAEETMYWKNLWNSNRAQPRPKDVKDIQNFKYFSAENPIIDLKANTSQYAPFYAESSLVDVDGYPIIHMVETYPGSGEVVPAIMNYAGEWKSPFTTNWLGTQFKKNGGFLNYLSFCK